MITFAQVDPGPDADRIVGFLIGNEFPYHGRTSWSEEQARQSITDGRFGSDDHLGFWIDVDRRQVGLVVLDDLGDIKAGGNPVFDLRLAEEFRGRGLGTPILRQVTALAFDRFPTTNRLEGQTREDNIAMRKVMLRSGFVKEAHYRDAWPIEGGGPMASVAYAILRRDWASGTTTVVVWDDLEV
ncbi:GNAT family N-acetyltransferase [Microlunatus sp. Gsoil 973]|jgi:RimJ/RimL family protein N-acetyltransferase|uniref:GNAT family N-acetyltransferase n=1 Tax=Microlunatus sp. Gsoil 973 TaxID=2672569 RepID=UPI0012B4D794|nr:GNAT family N-acetyltransferase [Microlunatus sp. Gsoil 973]